MISILKDVWKFLWNIVTIVKAWILETKEEHKFTNVLIPIIAAGVVLLSYSGIMFTGSNWRTLALWSVLIWIGMNVQGLISVFKKLKKDNKI